MPCSTVLPVEWHIHFSQICFRPQDPPDELVLPETEHVPAMRDRDTLTDPKDIIILDLGRRVKELTRTLEWAADRLDKKHQRHAWPLGAAVDLTTNDFQAFLRGRAGGVRVFRFRGLGRAGIRVKGFKGLRAQVLKGLRISGCSLTLKP